MTTTKNVLYAAVGAPVVAARRVADAVAELRSTLNKEADTLGKTANKRVSLWADEGEKLVNRITDAKMVDELTSKVDFDQVSNQVSKLRDQLEEMLATWRASFRPEKAGAATVPASPAALKLEARAAGARARRRTLENHPAPKAAAGKSSAAKSSADKSSAGKASASRSSAGKAPATKSSAGKAPAATKPSAGKSSAVRAPAPSGPAQKATTKAAPRRPASTKGAAKSAVAKPGSPPKSAGQASRKKASSTARKSAAAAG